MPSMTAQQSGFSENNGPETRLSLILKLKDSKDHQAWKEFVHIYYPLISNLASQKGLQDSDVKDVAQEVFAKVTTRIDSWNPNQELGSFRGWLATISRNLTIDCLRKKKRSRTSRIDSAMDFVHRDPELDSDFEKEHERQIFLWAARLVQKRFEKQTWSAFWLSTVEQFPIESVAEKLNTSKAQVYVARSRIMKAIKSKIESSQFVSSPEGERS